MSFLNFTSSPSKARGGAGSAVAALPLQVVFAIGTDEGTAELCRRLGTAFGYHVIPTPSGASSPFFCG